MSKNITQCFSTYRQCELEVILNVKESSVTCNDTTTSRAGWTVFNVELAIVLILASSECVQHLVLRITGLVVLNQNDISTRIGHL